MQIELKNDIQEIIHKYWYFIKPRTKYAILQKFK